ncbi:hypothetical protein, partial [Burkholderia ubonensis]|uniref:hypothetical protein n=1 Tax=Burkholderia ubonensis TaxID=101571 RepID=UPI001E5CBDDD
RSGACIPSSQHPTSFQVLHLKLESKQSGKSFAWRRTKRASSAFLFELLSQSEVNLADLIDRSHFVPLLHIDRRALLAEVRQNCRIALTGNFKHIVNLYKVEAHLRSIEHQSARLTRP